MTFICCALLNYKGQQNRTALFEACSIATKVKSVGFDLHSQHIGTTEHDLPNHAPIAASYTVPQ
jgi:hypothetical protein